MAKNLIGVFARDLTKFTMSRRLVQEDFDEKERLHHKQQLHYAASLVVKVSLKMVCICKKPLSSCS